MPQSWNSLITILSEITRNNLESSICCPHCSNCDLHIRWGFYSRYLFNGELINIQRYRCDNDQCSHKTFSILPHAFLPIVRTSLCMLMYILKMYQHGCCIADIARNTGSSWPKIQRWIIRALSIREWFKKEYRKDSPCLLPVSRWSSFTQKFSWAFYPKRL